MSTATTEALETTEAAAPSSVRIRRSAWVNGKLLTGLGLVAVVVLVGMLGPLFWDTELAYVGSSPLNLPPAWVDGGDGAHPLGTDNSGRDMLALVITGAPSSLRVGVIAAGFGVIAGIILGFTAGFVGGWVDNVIRTLSDSVVTIPALAVLIVLSSYVRQLNVENMALLLALFAWPGPTRLLRAQVLTMREQGYVKMARLSGVPTLRILFGEMMPNLMPYIASSLAGNISLAILAATSLEALGLGPTRVPTLGMTIFYSIRASAILRGMWWWWGIPIAVLVLIFIGLFLIAIGLDEVANPRLRKGKALIVEPDTDTDIDTDTDTDSSRARTAGEGGAGTIGTGASSGDLVLDVRDLRVHYATPIGPVQATQGVNLQVKRGEILGLVGESGCGKTTLAMAILRMVQPPGKIVGGRILVDDTDFAKLGERELRQHRWRKLALIPQGAMNSLNPTMPVHKQIRDVIETHEDKQPEAELKERILHLLELVNLPPRAYDLFPHELSGGMKQRVCIAMAIALNPPLIIADEPTSALDVMVQRHVAETLLDVRDRLGVAMILIGHDMGLQAQVVDRIAVMYAGNVAEVSPVEEIFAAPLHPYTQLLIESIPSIKERKPLRVTEGLTHDLRNPPPGCPFQFRCPYAMEHCRTDKPPLRELMQVHQAACHLYEERNGSIVNVSDGSQVRVATTARNA